MATRKRTELNPQLRSRLSLLLALAMLTRTLISRMDCPQIMSTRQSDAIRAKALSLCTWGPAKGGGPGVTDRGDGVFDISFEDWKKYFTDVTAVT